MFIKSLSFLLVTFLLLMPIAGLSAQDDDQGIDFCAILSEPDCQILEMSDDVMSELSSMTFTLSASGDIAYETTLGQAEDGSIDISGDVQVAFDVDATREWVEIDSDASNEEIAAILDRILESLTGAVSLNITETSSEGMKDIMLNLLMDGGTFVLDSASLESLTGESMAGLDWLGINMKGAMESIVSMPEYDSSVDISPAPNIYDLDGIEEALTITRLNDSDVNGVSVAVFQYDFDMVNVLEMLDLADLEGMAANSAMDQLLLDMSMDVMMDVLSNTTISMVIYVGLDDFYTYRGTLNMQMEIAGEMLGRPNVGDGSFTVTVDFLLSDHNEPVVVELPEDAMILPLMMLLQMGN